MAYRVVVDKPRQIRALVSSAKITAADVKLKKATAVITRPVYAAIPLVRNISAFAGYSAPISIIGYQNLTATGVRLDPFSLNKYFRLESFGLLDSPAVTVGKSPDEALSVSDIHNTIFSKGLNETPHLGDFAFIQLIIQRAFADLVTTSDSVSASYALGKQDFLSTYEALGFATRKGLSDAPLLADIFQREVSFSRELADATSLSDAVANSLSKGSVDSFGITDLFERTAIFNRAFDSSASFVDSHISDVSRVSSSVALVVDTESRAIGKGVADVASTTDYFSRTTAYARSFLDLFSLDDFTDVNAIQKATIGTKVNAIAFSESQAFGTQKNLTDTAALAELSEKHLDRPAAEAFSVSDLFAKVTTFSRAFESLTSITDSPSFAAGKDLVETLAVGDDFQKDVVFGRVFADAISFAEATAASFYKGVVEPVSFTETLTIAMASNASSALNAGALNTAPLNH